MPRYCPHCGGDIGGAWDDPLFRLTALDVMRSRRRVLGTCWLWTGSRNGKAGPPTWVHRRVRYDPRRLTAVLLLGYAPEETRTTTTTCGNPLCFSYHHVQPGPGQLTIENRRALRLDLLAGVSAPDCAARYGLSVNQVRRLRAWTTGHADEIDRIEGLIIPADHDPTILQQALLVRAARLRDKHLSSDTTPAQAG